MFIVSEIVFDFCNPSPSKLFLQISVAYYYKFFKPHMKEIEFSRNCFVGRCPLIVIITLRPFKTN